MPYDAQLAPRIQEMFADDPAVREQPMFGEWIAIGIAAATSALGARP